MYDTKMPTSKQELLDILERDSAEIETFQERLGKMHRGKSLGLGWEVVAYSSDLDSSAKHRITKQEGLYAAVIEVLDFALINSALLQEDIQESLKEEGASHE